MDIKGHQNAISTEYTIIKMAPKHPFLQGTKKSQYNICEEKGSLDQNLLYVQG